MNADIYRPNRGITQRYDVLRELGLCFDAKGDPGAAREYEKQAEILMTELMEINRKIERENTGSRGGSR